MGNSKKEKLNLWIAWGTIIIVILILFIISFHLYIQNRTYFVIKMNNILETAVQQFNGELLRDTSRGTVSSRDESTIWIIRDNEEHIFNYEKNKDINANFYRAIYDIVPLNSWNVKHLAEIIHQKMTDHCPPFVLMRIDSIGYVIDSYGYKQEEMCWGDFQYEYTIPLGFLDKHQLKVNYLYPWQIFWNLEGKTLMIIFILLTLIATCVGLFLKLLWNARRKMENQELFVQALNHDLKTPVAALQMMIYQIKACSVVPFSPVQNELYDQILWQIEGILNAADRLLQDSINARGIYLNLRPFDLKELIEKQVTIIKKIADKNKKVEIETIFQLTDSVVYVDGQHFSRAILNLLDNAVKYSGESVHVRISCRKEGKFLYITLQDDGMGIAKTELKHIFERNYRSKATNLTGGIRGFGIGLSYVKMIVKAHHGTIWVESEPGKKTLFIIKMKYGRKY